MSDSKGDFSNCSGSEDPDISFSIRPQNHATVIPAKRKSVMRMIFESLFNCFSASSSHSSNIATVTSGRSEPEQADISFSSRRKNHATMIPAKKKSAKGMIFDSLISSNATTHGCGGGGSINTRVEAPKSPNPKRKSSGIFPYAP